jgi:hypothetical protein
MRGTISLLAAALALVCSAPATSHGALLYRNYQPAEQPTLVPFMLATEFTVGRNPLAVKRLGVWTTGPYTYIEWKVAIWPVSDEPEPEEVAKAEIPVTSDHWVRSDRPNSAWLFADVEPGDPAVLLPHTTYRIGAAPDDDGPLGYFAVYPTGGTFSKGGGIASVTPGSFGVPWYEEPGLTYPTVHWPDNPMLIANVEYEVLGPVPEPSSALLLVVGLGGLWLFGRRVSPARAPDDVARGAAET